jgi:RED-like protein N-terminal region
MSSDSTAFSEQLSLTFDCILSFLVNLKSSHSFTCFSNDSFIFSIKSEQTKFLGGDVEHTHLVKGLDYALLRKIRDQEKVQNEDENEATTENKLEKELKSNSKQNALSTNKNVPIVKKVEGYKDFRTTSAMAETLKNMLLNPESSLNITRTASVSSIALCCVCDNVIIKFKLRFHIKIIKT